jgi:hypothetical protein
MEVYQNSTLTIAASRAADQDSGCFSNSREAYQFHKLGKVNNKGTTFDLVARKLIPHITGLDSVSNQDDQEFPLLQRAWAYQERLLSPCIL